LNFARIRFPIGAMASIGHRISGVILACSLPLAVFALHRSMEGQAEFASLIDTLRSPVGRVGLVLFAWACTHHLAAGIRHLLMDVGVGASLTVARRSAYAAIGTAVAVAAAVAVVA